MFYFMNLSYHLSFNVLILFHYVYHRILIQRTSDKIYVLFCSILFCSFLNKSAGYKIKSHSKTKKYITN